MSESELFDRRALMVGASVLAVASVTSGVAHADSEGIISLSPPKNNVQKKTVTKLSADAIVSRPSKNYPDMIRGLGNSAIKFEDPTIRFGKAKLPEIAEPIDSGAKDLLEKFSESNNHYSIWETEYLARTLIEHVQNCIDIREKGQQLEVDAILTRLDYEFNESLVKIAELQESFDFENSHLQLSKMVNPKIASDGSIQSETVADSSIDNNFQYQQRLISQKSIEVRHKQLSDKKTYITRDGSGLDHVSRFKFQKRLFETEISEAYKRARSLAAGMELIYGIKRYVPVIKDIGYLDELAIWTKETTYILESQLLNRTLNTTIIPISHSDAKKGFNLTSVWPTISDSGKANLDFSNVYDTYIHGLKPLVRGISLVIWQKSLAEFEPIQAEVKLDKQEVKFSAPRKTKRDWNRTPKVTILGERYSKDAYGTQPSQSSLHNAPISKNSKWAIDFSSTGIFEHKYDKRYYKLGLLISYTSEKQ